MIDALLEFLKNRLCEFNSDIQQRSVAAEEGTPNLIEEVEIAELQILIEQTENAIRLLKVFNTGKLLQREEANALEECLRKIGLTDMSIDIVMGVIITGGRIHFKENVQIALFDIYGNKIF